MKGKELHPIGITSELTCQDAFVELANAAVFRQEGGHSKRDNWWLQRRFNLARPIRYYSWAAASDSYLLEIFNVVFRRLQVQGDMLVEYFSGVLWNILFPIKLWLAAHSTEKVSGESQV